MNITIPRETFDQMLYALTHGIKWLNICDKPKECIPLHAALSAAKAVSEPTLGAAVGELASPEYDQLRAKVQKKTDCLCGRYEFCPDCQPGVFGEVQPQAQGEASCGTCGNTYLAVRTDVYKDKREFVYCDCCGAMADRKTWNRAHPQASEPAWLPIETAPKDGTVVFLYGLWAGEINGIEETPQVDVGYWSSGRGDYFNGEAWATTTGDAYACWMKPTHWMPLPAAPEATK